MTNIPFMNCSKIPPHVSVKELFLQYIGVFSFFLIGMFSIHNLHDFQVNGDTAAVGLWEKPLKYNFMEQRGRLKNLVGV